MTQAHSTVAVWGERDAVLAALLVATRTVVAGSAERHRFLDQALDALLQSFDVLVTEKSKNIAVALWSQGVWTMIEDPRGAIAGDPAVLEQLSDEANARVVARIHRPEDKTYGLAVYDDGKCRRLYLQLAGAVIEDAGRLEDEDPAVGTDPDPLVDEVWGNLVPIEEATEIEVRILRPT
ncbi:MAG: hypothetical protein L0216_18175 [Planctomycetales bacterium]|nr:hypothetical protein [Planctomycetales bacterium]